MQEYQNRLCVLLLPKARQLGHRLEPSGGRGRCLSERQDAAGHPICSAVYAGNTKAPGSAQPSLCLPAAFARCHNYLPRCMPLQLGRRAVFEAGASQPF